VCADKPKTGFCGEIDWRVTFSGTSLHAVRRLPGNRNSLCFQLCEAEPYPIRLQQQLEKRPVTRRCTRCEKKLLELQPAVTAKRKKGKNARSHVSGAAGRTTKIRCDAPPDSTTA